MIFSLYGDEPELVRKAYEGKTVGLITGTFDLLHPVHQQCLDCYRRFCGHDGALIVGVDSDHLVRLRKGPERPYTPEADRLYMIHSSKSVSAAFILGTVEDHGRAVELLGVKYIFKNEEYRDIKVLGADLPGVELIIVPDFNRTDSTSSIVDRIKNGRKTV